MSTGGTVPMSSCERGLSRPARTTTPLWTRAPADLLLRVALDGCGEPSRASVRPGPGVPMRSRQGEGGRTPSPRGSVLNGSSLVDPGCARLGWWPVVAASVGMVPGVCLGRQREGCLVDEGGDGRGQLLRLVLGDERARAADGDLSGIGEGCRQPVGEGDWEQQLVTGPGDERWVDEAGEA